MSILHKTLRRGDHNADHTGGGAQSRPAKPRPAAAPAPTPAPTPDPEIENLRGIVRTRERRIQELERALHELDHERTEALHKSEARVQTLEAQVQALVQKLAEAVAGLQRARKQGYLADAPRPQASGPDAGPTGSLLSQAKSRQ